MIDRINPMLGTFINCVVSFIIKSHLCVTHIYIETGWAKTGRRADTTQKKESHTDSNVLTRRNNDDDDTHSFSQQRHDGIFIYYYARTQLASSRPHYAFEVAAAAPFVDGAKH